MPINIEKYMKEEIRYRPVGVITPPASNDKGVIDFGELPNKTEVPDEIRYARMDGETTIQLTTPEGNVITTEKYRYLSVEKFNKMDTINGMLIRGINTIYNFNGSVSHYEYTVY